MSRLLGTAQILRRAENPGAGVPVEAEVWIEIGADELKQIETTWGPVRRSIIERLTSSGVPEDSWPQHFHWDWSWKAEALVGGPGRAAIALRRDGQWQGWALLVNDPAAHAARLPPIGQPLVYVDYLENAPWNLSLRGIQDRPRFSAIGTRLLQSAVRLSLQEGFDGRTGLHSLPQAERFYGRCGMKAVGTDPAYHDLLYFEFAAPAARAFLEEP